MARSTRNAPTAEMCTRDTFSGRSAERVSGGLTSDLPPILLTIQRSSLSSWGVIDRGVSERSALRFAQTLAQIGATAGAQRGAQP